MSLTLGDNFSYQASKPLDARLKYDTLAAMKTVGDSTMYDGCLAYCVATDKTYQWKSTNTVDTDLGKWREFSSGGGGGHEIEDSEGTALTQRNTMQFGDGFNASDDSENEKTVVEPCLMTDEDMDDVVTPLPSVQSRYHKYSTTEQVVGTWIDGKPLYAKSFANVEFTVTATTSTRYESGKAIFFNETEASDKVLIWAQGFATSKTDQRDRFLFPFTMGNPMIAENDIYGTGYVVQTVNDGIYLAYQRRDSANITNRNVTGTIYYIKTTD